MAGIRLLITQIIFMALRIFVLIALLLSCNIADAQVVIIRTLGFDYSGISSCDDSGEYHTVSKDDRLQLFLKDTLMIEVMLSYSPTGDASTTIDSFRISSIKILKGQEGKYFEITTDYDVTYRIDSKTVTVIDRVKDSHTIERTSIDEVETNLSELTTGRSYVSQMVRTIEANKKIHVKYIR